MIDQLQEMKSLLSDLKNLILRSKLGGKHNEDLGDEEGIDIPDEHSKELTVIKDGPSQNNPEAFIEEKDDSGDSMSPGDEQQDRDLIKNMLGSESDDADSEDDSYKKPDHEIIQVGSRKIKRMKV
jgi:hypothetical protein